MRNNDDVGWLGIGIVSILVAIGIYTVWWSWSYLSNQLDSTIFALLLTIPLTGIIFGGLRIAFVLTIMIFVSLFGNNR